ncbi:g1548 [Coccomyxa elongata]
MAPRVSAQQWRGIQRAHKGCQEMSKDSSRQQNDSGSSSQSRVPLGPACMRNNHFLIHREFREHRRALQIASAFTETAKLARRIRELEMADTQLEQHREVLRAAIAFHRRRRTLHRELAAIPEGDSEQPPQPQSLLQLIVQPAAQSMAHPPQPGRCNIG